MKPISMSTTAECAAAHQGPVLSGDAVVEAGKVRNAFVWIKDGLGDKVFAVPATPVVVDQVGCLYVPRVAGAQVGQPIEFRNSDATMHNVRGKPSEASGWNVSLARQGTQRTITVDRPEVAISVRCDVHPWMQGWVGVVDHPFFGVTGADGRVTLAGVPAGQYTVGVWHERFCSRTGTATVTPQGTAEVAVAFGGATGN
jgi:plastocyanin